MDWIEALILGLVQGLAEYLPISSSGHLVIARDILGLHLDGAEALTFDVTLHVATVLSTIVILWREFVPLCNSFFHFRNDNNTRTVVKILVSCIPVAIVGLLFKDVVEEFFEGNLRVVGTCLLITAALLTFSYYFRTRPLLQNGARAYRPRNISMLDAFIIGCAQAVAVLPGLSRSGTTIATGILLGDKREQVATFSFLMVIIPILGEALLGVKDIIKGEGAYDAIGLLPLAIGFVTAFISGCLACKWMLSLVKRGKLIWFAVYCAVVGIVCLVF